MARDRMPVLEGLVYGESALGDLVSLGDPSEAQILASIVTGKFEFKHGVRSDLDLAGLDSRSNPMRVPVWEVIRDYGGRVTAVGFPFGATSWLEAEELLRGDPERHLFLRLGPFPSGAADGKPPAQALERHYASIDRTLGELMEKIGTENTTWVIVSERPAPLDAGLNRGRLPEFERREQAGFFLAWGREIERSVVPHTIDPVDLAPTILYLSGCPIPNDMDGIVLFEMLNEEYRFKHRLAFGA
jgi:predicted AlkP superfamily phosphohydrolase/phosphomutase